MGQLRQWTVEINPSNGSFPMNTTVQAESVLVHDGSLLFFVSDPTQPSVYIAPGTVIPEPKQILVQGFAANAWRRFW